MLGLRLLQADVSVVDHADRAAEVAELVSKLTCESAVALEDENLNGHGDRSGRSGKTPGLQVGEMEYERGVARIAFA